MEAKDTVMSKAQRIALPSWDRQSLTEAQAEISFKAGQDESWEKAKSFFTEESIDAVFKGGKKAGIKEVVEFTKSYWGGLNIWKSPDGQAQLKEWGIKSHETHQD